MPASEVAALICHTEQKGWRQALFRFEKQYPFFVKRILNTGLGDWHLLLSVSAAKSVLDVGCGFGTMALGFSKHYAEAFGIEALPERLLYAEIRARQEKMSNLRFVKGSGLNMPFRNSAFGLVTLNGVLEWAGLYEPTLKADILQKAMLREAKRVSTPNGVVAVAIENRFAMESLTGMADTHTGIKFITVFPRKVSNIISLIINGRNYRSFLYSARGYSKLFHEVGFERVVIYDLISSYNDYDFVVERNDAPSYRFLYCHQLVRPFYPPAAKARNLANSLNPGLLSQFSYAYLVVGGHSFTSLFGEKHPIWNHVRSLGLSTGSARFACRAAKPGAMLIICHNSKKVLTILRLCTGRESSVYYEEKLPEWLESKYRIHPVSRQFIAVSGISARAFRVDLSTCNPKY